MDIDFDDMFNGLEDPDGKKKRHYEKDEVSRNWRLQIKNHGKPQMNRGRLDGRPLRINDMLPTCDPTRCNFHEENDCKFHPRAEDAERAWAWKKGTCRLLYLMYGPIAMDWYRRYLVLESQADLDSIGLFLIPKLIDFLRIQRGIMFTEIPHDRGVVLEKGIMDILHRLDRKMAEETKARKPKNPAKKPSIK